MVSNDPITEQQTREIARKAATGLVLCVKERCVHRYLCIRALQMTLPTVSDSEVLIF